LAKRAVGDLKGVVGVANAGRPAGDFEYWVEAAFDRAQGG